MLSVDKKPIVGIIGLGIFSLDFAQRCADAGYDILVGSIECLHICNATVGKIGKKARAVPLELAASADILFIFSPKEKSYLLSASLPCLAGKMVFFHQYYFQKRDIRIRANEKKPSLPLFLYKALRDADVVQIYSSLTKSASSGANCTLYYSTNCPAVAETAVLFLDSINYKTPIFLYSTEYKNRP
jgi:predicted dinucleotide-binding enzyme